MTKQTLTLAVILLAASATGALAAPPPPPPRPPHTAPPVAEFKVCRDRYYLLYDKSSYMEIRPCTIKATAKA